jgi:hypothetical protein
MCPACGEPPIPVGVHEIQSHNGSTGRTAAQGYRCPNDCPNRLTPAQWSVAVAKAQERMRAAR